MGGRAENLKWGLPIDRQIPVILSVQWGLEPLPLPGAFPSANWLYQLGTESTVCTDYHGMLAILLHKQAAKPGMWF